MMPSHKEIRAKMRDQALSDQPRMLELEKQLLEIGGESMVFRYEEDLKNILASGKDLSSLKVKLKKGLQSQCHHNTAVLYQKLKDQGFQIVTGWALSSDGDWRQHSWGLLDNTIIETTEKRTKYFGVVLEIDETLDFLHANY